MGAQIIIPQEKADEGFSLLRDIVEMVKNPKAIDDAYERRRKAAMLSDDEVAKSEAARALIAEADALRDDIKLREDNLAAEIAAHSQAVSDFTANSAEARDSLEKRGDELALIASAQAETAAVQKFEQEKISVRAAEIESARLEWEKRYDERVALIAEEEQAQKEERSKLNDERKKIREKAEKLANLAQSDE